MKKSPAQKIAAAGFTLIEMIGVLAIIGVLAAVVAPRVIETIRDAKVTSAISSATSAKSAALNYYQRYDSFLTNLEAQSSPVPSTVTLPVGIGSNYRNFGDVLQYQEGFIEQVKLPVGRIRNDGVGSNQTWMIGCVTVSPEGTGTLTTEPGTQSFEYGVQGKVFKSANKGTMVLYYYVPALTLQQAASLATKINGPFPNTVSGDISIVNLTLDGVMSGPSESWYQGANVFFKSSTEFPGYYDAFLYISHI
jgi:prepilin-type N-terminal cleavage/methylation domain-containing protein